MKTIRYTCRQHDGLWIGYLEEFPDYWTQGETLDELKENLRDVYEELVSGTVLAVRRTAELQVG